MTRLWIERLRDVYSNKYLEVAACKRIAARDKALAAQVRDNNSTWTENAVNSSSGKQQQHLERNSAGLQQQEEVDGKQDCLWGWTANGKQQ
jgi:hypothetical protein